MAEKDRVWFITGASSGFGQALAESVLQRGERAILAARRAERLEAVVARYPDTALALPLDITDAGSRQVAVRAALDRFDRIDVLANIAGRGSLGAVEEFAVDQLREQMELNFFATAELTRAVLPHMRARRQGHVLNLTSIGGLISMGGFGAYCASKFALEGWSQALRDEVAPFGIKVTLVEPGSFRTEFAGDTNMRPATQMDEYRPAITPIEQYLYGHSGQQPGDPVRAAEVMIAVVDAAAPPLRVMLGADAYALWDQNVETRTAEVAAWRSLGEATTYPDAATISIDFNR